MTRVGVLQHCSFKRCSVQNVALNVAQSVLLYDNMNINLQNPFSSDIAPHPQRTSINDAKILSHQNAPACFRKKKKEKGKENIEGTHRRTLAVSLTDTQHLL